MSDNLIKVAVIGGGGILFAVVTCIFTGIPVMLLWNWLAPEIFDLPTVTFWQAFGLSVLCALLFKSYRTSSK